MVRGPVGDVAPAEISPRESRLEIFPKPADPMHALVQNGDEADVSVAQLLPVDEDAVGNGFARRVAGRVVHQRCLWNLPANDGPLLLGHES